ncbi:DUF397 domain-containing protein [Actinacidiphila alni]|uniref:DUF397 domain-containing protein n=1 Tax=Actinacidiphila alni TaxID=380248 RepID=A0A1I2B0U9_9ACTN|nr:DUF397 domain-containing protein [Actinacidiphila alni]SFE49805.1 protein of unknown function [Actinacidiphila alni]
MAAQSGFVSSSASIHGVTWRRSSHSTAANNCVETAALTAGLLAVRDSKDVTGPALLFPAASWAHFVHAVRRDDLGPA